MKTDFKAINTELKRLKEKGFDELFPIISSIVKDFKIPEIKEKSDALKIITLSLGEVKKGLDKMESDLRSSIALSPGHSGWQELEKESKISEQISNLNTASNSLEITIRCIKSIEL